MSFSHFMQIRYVDLTVYSDKTTHYRSNCDTMSAYKCFPFLVSCMGCVFNPVFHAFCFDDKL